MYRHHINDMVKLVCHEVGHEHKEAVDKAITDYWQDRIACSWHVDDILDRAEERDIPLSREQALDILGICLHRFDACHGINWDVIDAHTDWFVSVPNS